MNTTLSRAHSAPSAFALIEESVHLLRQTSPATFCIYYLGTAPFALGFVFFWAWATWFQPSGAAMAWASLLLVVLFGVMKTLHAEFCRRLLDRRMGAQPPVLSVARLRKVGAAQFVVQVWGVLLIPIAAIVGVPFGWVYAFFQSAAALGDSDALTSQAVDQAKLWPAQNHLGQLLLSGVFVATWLNIAAAFWAVPWLANRLLGLENIFGLTGWWFFNTTFLASTVVLTWLIVDPLVKAFFTLRVFYGRARRNGEDLSIELSRAQEKRIKGGSRTMARVSLMLLISILGTAGIASRSQAAEMARPVQAVDPIQLDRAIDQILSGSDFDWRLRPLPAKEQEGEAGAVKTFVREAIKQLQRVRRWIGQTWEDLRSWMRRLFPDSGAVETPKSTAAAGSIVETLVWIFLILLGLAFAAVLVLAWKRRQPARPQLLRARAIRAAAPDLQDESTHASQLPMEGWLALAREQMSRGEWRLAWRALYLASLARLSAQGLIALAKFKTNLDYEREVRRRGAGQTELVSWFSHRRDAFESVWYGRAGVIETEAREWLTELEEPLAP